MLITGEKNLFREREIETPSEARKGGQLLQEIITSILSHKSEQLIEILRI